MEVVLIGAGGFCQQVIDAFETRRIKIKGLLDDNRNDDLLGYPILGKTDDYVITTEKLFCAIGNVATRMRLFENYPDNWVNCIHPAANLSEHAEIGVGNYIGPGACVMPGAHLGNNNILDPLCVVSHDVTIGNHNHIAAHACLLGRVTIGDCNLIGANSTILPDLFLRNNNILGAGGVLTRSTTNDKTLVGIPARERD